MTGDEELVRRNHVADRQDWTPALDDALDVLRAHLAGDHTGCGHDDSAERMTRANLAGLSLDEWDALPAWEQALLDATPEQSGLPRCWQVTVRHRDGVITCGTQAADGIDACAQVLELLGLPGAIAEAAGITPPEDR